MTSELPPSLDELIAQSRAVTADALAGIDASREQLAQMYREQRAEREAAQQAHAQRARSGELGPEQRRLQERIDLGQTDLVEVMEGRDESPEAAAFRTTVAENGAAFAAAVEEQLETDALAGRADPRAAVQDTVEELRAMVAQLSVLEQEISRGQ